jgi:hypothetical protein
MFGEGLQGPQVIFDPLCAIRDSHGNDYEDMNNLKLTMKITTF